MNMPKFKKSSRKSKKYMVQTPSGKWIHFGDSSMQHYKDNALGIWSNLDQTQTNL